MLIPIDTIADVPFNRENKKKQIMPQTINLMQEY